MLDSLVKYTRDILAPVIRPEFMVAEARPYGPNLSLSKGQPLAFAAVAVNAVQTITVTGTPDGGSFTLTYDGFTTDAIAYNASASVVRAALEALPSIGSGNITASGGALPGTAVVITFAGILAGMPVKKIEKGTNSLTGGTDPDVSVAHTTVGARAGSVVAWNGALQAAPSAPTVSAVSGGTAFGDGTDATVHYQVTAAYYNAYGESLPSKGVQVVVTASNRTIRVAEVTGLASHIAGIRYYVNGIFAVQVAASSGTVAQTNITDWGTTTRKPDEIGWMPTTSDGSHILLGLCPCQITTDEAGNISFGSTSAGHDFNQKATNAPVITSGYFKVSDVYGLTSANGPSFERLVRIIGGTYQTSGARFYI